MSLLGREGRRSAARAAKKHETPASTGPPEAQAQQAPSVRDRILEASGGAARAGEAVKRAPDYAFLARPPANEGIAAGPDADASAQRPAAARPSAAPEEPAAPGIAIHDSDRRVLALHLGAEPTLGRPTLPPPEPPDPGPQRALIESGMGIAQLEARLAPFGMPPVAPPAKKVDSRALERDLLSAGATGVSRWKVGAHRSLRNEAREQASQQAHAENERFAAERQQLQRELDEHWAELRALRHRAALETEQWVKEEVHRRELAHAAEQDALEQRWRRQADANPQTVAAALRTAFQFFGDGTANGGASAADGITTVLGFLDGVVVLVVACLDRDDLIADTGPVSKGGRRRTANGSEARRNQLYLAAIASRVLAAVGRALSATPAVDAVACVAIRPGKSSGSPWEPVYSGTFARDYAEGLLSAGRWSSDPVALVKALEEAEEVELEPTGSDHELGALDLSEDPGFRAVVDRMDPANRSDDDAGRQSDQDAAKMFLNGGEIAHDQHEQRGDEEVAQPRGDNTQLQGDNSMTHESLDMAVRAEPEVEHNEPAGDAQPGADVTTHQEPKAESDMQAAEIQPMANGLSQQDSPASSDGSNASGAAPGGDPLPEALRDSDASVRRAAVEAIGRRSDAADTPLLLKCLSDPDDIVRLEAMYALKDRLSPDMRRDAIITASGDRDETVRRKAIEALADLGDDRDTPVLLQALRDAVDSVRLEAIYAIKHRLAPDMRDALVDACSDANDSVRRKAIEALAQLDDERDTPLLLKALRDPDSSVRLEAIYALEGRSNLGSSSQLSEPLLEAMKADDAVVRQAAVRLFGRL